MPEMAQDDAALRRFLGFLERDILSGNVVDALPPEVMMSLTDLRTLDIDPNDPIEGETVL